MPAGKRIKGQEAEIRVQFANGEVRSITDVKSFEFTLDSEILEEGYLGHKHNSFDDVYKGVEGSLEAHLESGDIFDFVMAAINRMKASTAGLQFHANCTMAFPDGTQRRLFFNNIFFGGFPFTIGGRTEYVTMKSTFKCSEMTIGR